MKISWNSFKVSIAGAKLSHLVQKDKIWDHGSMIEQVKTIFFKIQRVKNSGNIDDVKKYVTENCFEKLKKELDALNEEGKTWAIKNPLIREISVIAVSPAKYEKPDGFIALIKAMGVFFIADKISAKEQTDHSQHVKNISEQWSFIRNGEWWILDKMK